MYFFFQHCPYKCELGMWSEWSDCKGQIKTRSRSHFGMNCEKEDCIEILRCGKYLHSMTKHDR